MIAENFLSSFQNQPTVESLLALYKKFKVTPIEDRDRKLKIIKNAQELTITQNYLGTYRFINMLINTTFTYSNMVYNQ